MRTTAGDLRIGLVGVGGADHMRALERRPVESLWIGGHIASRNPSPEVMMNLARLAALTEQVTVGTAVLPLPLYPPALIAKQAADLDNATDGRVVLGVGVGGEYPQEFRAMQVPVAERGRRTDEAIRLLRRFWTADPVTHHGRHYDIEDVRIHPAPVQPGGPPIVVGGRKQAAMRRAGTLGDGWFPYLYSPRRYLASVEAVQAAAAGAGRDLAGFEWMVWVFVNIDPDGNAARETAAQTLGAAHARDLRAMVDDIAAAGTAAEVTARLVAFHDVGARHFVFCPATAGADPTPVLDRLFGDVVPALREHAGRRTAVRRPGGTSF